VISARRFEKYRIKSLRISAHKAFMALPSVA
jgi:hypothetical protein